MRIRTFIYNVFCLIMVSLIASCAIKDDIPFPFVEGAITAFEVEGQCDANGNEGGTAVIDNNARTVKAYVNDLVDISHLKITRMETSNDAAVIMDSVVYQSSDIYPLQEYTKRSSFSDFRADFSYEQEFTLRTYQDYIWKVSVEQIIDRQIEIEGQVGKAVIDPDDRVAIVYVGNNQDLKRLKVRKFQLGGEHGAVVPDPTAVAVYDFSEARKFYVRNGWSEQSYLWNVYVYITEASVSTTANVFARSVSATVSGDLPNGTSPRVEYHRQGLSDWLTVPESQIKTTSTTYEAEITGLQPSTIYDYRVTAGTSATLVQSFTTATATPLENGTFDNWSISGTGTQAVYQPWGDGHQSFWDTGNRGATTVGASNSTYVDEGGRRFANLQSKYIVIKFAAGNIFTGSYLQTDGTNGVLSFGRPFNSFPTKLRFEYKYKTSPINRMGGDWKEPWGRYISRDMYENMKGKPDSCSVYIALGDWEPVMYKNTECPYLIRTRPSELHLFDLKDEHIIAYAQMTKGEDVPEWTTETLTLDYRVKNRQPKYIIVVASSSKYGDYFTGGDQSLLQVDNMELLYE
ncbi:MAG: PCMD domain-containing protein [Bacteroidaceae bacterium]|nr:PCMD domain-containing protein [Bacteroidaceae bacterium]